MVELASQLNAGIPSWRPLSWQAVAACHVRGEHGISLFAWVC